MSHKITRWSDDDADELLQPLFVQIKSGSATTNATRSLTIKPLEYFPGLFSTDPQYLRFLGDLSDRLEAELPENTDDLGRTYGNGVKKSWYSLRHVGGVPMHPATFVLADNRSKRSEYGLSNEWKSDFDKELFKAIVAATLSAYDPKGLRLAKGTSSGIPFFTTQSSAKRQIVLDALRDASAAAKLIAEGDAGTAFLRYGIGGAYTSVFRDQYNDGVQKIDGRYVSKDRTVADAEYSASDGKRGRLFVANKNISEFASDLISGVPNGFFAARRRLALAMPLGMGAIIQTWAQSFRSGMYERYPLAFKHTTREVMADKLRQFEEALFTDVSDHDTLWPSHLYVPAMCEVMKDLGFSEDFLTLFKTSLQLPVYMSAYSYDDKDNHALIGDWRDPDLSMGMPSGWPGTDLCGTQGMTFVYMLFNVQHVDDVLRRDLSNAFTRDPSWRSLLPVVHNWLNWKYDSGLLDKVDDAINCARGECARKLLHVHQSMADGQDIKWSAYMDISYEVGTAFLGTQAIFPPSKKLSEVHLTGDITSYVKNLFLNEYSIDLNKPRESRMRKYPGIAHASAAEVYGSAPSWRVVNDIIEATFFDHYGESFRVLRDRQLDEDKNALAQDLRVQASQLDAIGLTRADIEVLADPSKLHYKYTEDDINPYVLSLYAHNIDPTLIQDFYAFMLNPETLNSTIGGLLNE